MLAVVLLHTRNLILAITMLTAPPPMMLMPTAKPKPMALTTTTLPATVREVGAEEVAEEVDHLSHLVEASFVVVDLEATLTVAEEVKGAVMFLVEEEDVVEDTLHPCLRRCPQNASSQAKLEYRIIFSRLIFGLGLLFWGLPIIYCRYKTKVAMLSGSFAIDLHVPYLVDYSM